MESRILKKRGCVYRRSCVFRTWQENYFGISIWIALW